MTHLTTVQLDELEKNADLSLTQGVPNIMTTAELRALIHAAREVEHLDKAIKIHHQNWREAEQQCRTVIQHRDQLEKENDLLTRKLQAAIDGLKSIHDPCPEWLCYSRAEQTLKTIEEMK
jgi:hypothetical protein